MLLIRSQICTQSEIRLILLRDHNIVPLLRHFCRIPILWYCRTRSHEDSVEAMLEEIRRQLNFTSLRFNRLDDLIEATGLDKSKLCTYCWDGEE